MSQVEPQTPLPLVYQVNDHNDASRDSYYVRAVVRDSLTGATLIAKNLTSGGAGRYASQFNAPVDGTGLGRQIDVTTTVYSDSGYTTKHPSYAEVLERWYVKNAPSNFGGGGGGESVDYERIKNLVDHSVTTGVKTIDFPASADLAPLRGALKRIEGKVDRIELTVPESEPVDLSPVHTAIETSHRELVARIEGIPEPEPTDLSGVLEGIQNLAAAIGEVGDLTTGQKDELKRVVETTLRDLYSKNKQAHSKVREALAVAFGTDEHPAPTEPAKLKHPLFQ